MKKPKLWHTPAGKLYGLYDDILKQTHVLIAGASGSGKSVLLNGIIYTALYSAPGNKELVLIDPKRVDLRKFRELPHAIYYASEPAEIVHGLRALCVLMDKRYKILCDRGLSEWDGGHMYVIIDEFADLMTTQKRETLPPLLRLAQLGRAAHIHLIIATQRPTRDIVNGQIKVNIDAFVALRCPSAQDSRNIIGISGAERLPRYGQALYLTPETMQPAPVAVPYIEPDELAARVKHWTDQKDPPRRHFWQR